MEGLIMMLIIMDPDSEIDSFETKPSCSV